MPRHLSKLLLAVVSALSGSVQFAAMSGNARLHNVCGTIVVVFNAAELIPVETCVHTRRLKQCNSHR